MNIMNSTYSSLEQFSRPIRSPIPLVVNSFQRLWNNSRENYSRSRWRFIHALHVRGFFSSDVYHYFLYCDLFFLACAEVSFATVIVYCVLLCALWITFNRSNSRKVTLFMLFCYAVSKIIVSTACVFHVVWFRLLFAVKILVRLSLLWI